MRLVNIILLFLFTSSCSLYLSKAPSVIKFDDKIWTKKVYRCSSPSFDLRLILEKQDENRKKILLESVSQLFKISLLKIEKDGEKLSHQTSSNLQSHDLIKLGLHNLWPFFFKDEFVCCTYVSEDGFLVNQSKTLGVKKDNHRIFRLYRLNKVVAEVEESEAGFSIRASTFFMNCLLENIVS